MSRYEDDRWQAIDHGLETGGDQPPDEPPPPPISNIISDLADYQPTPSPRSTT